MRSSLMVLIIVFLSSGCSKDKQADKGAKPAPADKPAVVEPASTKTKDTASRPPPTAKAPPPKTPPAASANEFDAFSKAVLTALGAKDSAKLTALTLGPTDVMPMLEMAKKNCPEKFPAGADLAEATKQMSDMLGGDAERAKTYGEYHAECAKVGDFSKATFKSATAKDATLECGGGGADHLVIEAEIEGKPVFVKVDDPIKTGSGWRMPDPIRCSEARP